MDLGIEILNYIKNNRENSVNQLWRESEDDLEKCSWKKIRINKKILSHFVCVNPQHIIVKHKKGEKFVFHWQKINPQEQEIF